MQLLTRSATLAARSGMALDLGTANTKFWFDGNMPKEGHGVSLKEITEYDRSNAIMCLPSFLGTYSHKSDAEIGQKPKDSYRRTSHTSDYQPYKLLEEGRITQHRKVIRFIGTLLSLYPKNLLHKSGVKPNVITGVPPRTPSADIDTTFNSVREATKGEVYIVDDAILAAIGAGCDIEGAKAIAIVDIGGGTCDIAIVANHSTIYSNRVTDAGDSLNRHLQYYMHQEHQIEVDETEAEMIKISCGIAMPIKDLVEFKANAGLEFVPPDNYLFTGWHRTLDRREQVTLRPDETCLAFEKPLRQLEDGIKEAIRRVEPGVRNYLMNRGLILTGGGAQLIGLDARLEKNLGIPVTIPSNAARAVIDGGKKVLKDKQKLLPYITKNIKQD